MQHSYCVRVSTATLLKIYSFICFWLRGVFIALPRLPPAVGSRVCSLAVLLRLLTTVASPVMEHGLQGIRASTAVAHGLGRCSFRALGHKLNSCGKWA